MRNTELAFLSAAELGRLIRDRKISPVEATRCYLDRIDALDFKFNAFITVCRKDALEEAKKAGLVRSGGAWEHYPSDMLFARALTRGARRFAPDAFLGMPIYTVGETGDDQARPPQPESVTTKAAETTPVVVEQSYGHSYPVRAAELSYQEQQDEDAKAPSNAYGYYKYLLGLQPEDGPKFQEVGKPTPKHIQALQGNFDQRGIEYAVFNGNLAEEMGK